MRRDPTIPLFLWVTAAIVAHAVGGGGATEVMERIEETMDIGSFASDVRRIAKGAGRPIEVSFVEDQPAPEALDHQLHSTSDEDLDLSEDEKSPEHVHFPEEEKEKKPETPEESKAQQEALEKEKEKKPDLALEREKPKISPPVVLPNRRVAVEQHVEDKDQEDNPNAQFAGEHANRVEEETQARITATDQNNEKPSMGSQFAGEDKEPGNSNESRVAQSDEIAGDKDKAPADSIPEEAAMASKLPAAQEAQGGARPETTPPLRTADAQTAQSKQDPSRAEEGMAETLTGNSSYQIARSKEQLAAQAARREREELLRLRPNRPSDPSKMFGFGSHQTTASGVNLNLNQTITSAVINPRAIDEIRHKDGQRRLSQHRGSWTAVGLERWKPALENYVASVKPGNQTALNTARVPFARYLNQIHQRLHDVFAHGFLGHLDRLPGDHPLNNQEMSTHVEIALSREDGRIVRMGVTKSSGVTAFDVGALESVKKAAPYGVPPGSIVSSDGNVYLHWEFHRKREYACSTYFAHPYIIDAGQKTAPPRVEPPRPPSEDSAPDERGPDERSGGRVVPESTPSKRAAADLPQDASTPAASHSPG